MFAKLKRLHSLGRVTDGLQVIMLGTMGQFFLSPGGAKQLSAPHWVGFRDFMGGQQGTGLSVLGIAIIGLLGIFTLALTKTDKIYTGIMWAFSGSAALWCFTTAGFQTYALIHLSAGNAGLWTWTMTGLFFLFSRTAITISSGLASFTNEESDADPA